VNPTQSTKAATASHGLSALQAARALRVLLISLSTGEGCKHADPDTKAAILEEAAAAVMSCVDSTTPSSQGRGEATPNAACERPDPRPTHRCKARSGTMRCQLRPDHTGSHRSGPAEWEQVQLIDALVNAAVRENDRAVRQALEATLTGTSTATSGRTWDTAFRALFERVLRDHGINDDDDDDDPPSHCVEFERALRALHVLEVAGEGNSNEADFMREAMDASWSAMTQDEQERMRKLSVDLYNEKRPPGFIYAPYTPDFVE